jgi:hypothetical protein
MGEAAGQNSTTLLLGSRKKFAETYIKAAKTKRNSLSFEEAEVLRERADAFLENAKHCLTERTTCFSSLSSSLMKSFLSLVAIPFNFPR